MKGVNIMMDLVIETFQDTYTMVPLLFLMYLALEYLEYHPLPKLEHSLKTFGPLYGSLVGLLPQCGFSVMASVLFMGGKITLGTLISIFIATSDEAIPMLLMYPDQYRCLIRLLGFKFLLGVIVGYLVDRWITYPTFTYNHTQSNHEHSHSMVKEAFKRTFSIYFFIILVSLGLSFSFEFIGQERLAVLLGRESLLQPIVSALFGFIPNCIASVILVELHVTHILSFPSLLAGLMTNAGLGLLTLIKYKVPYALLGKIILILFSVSSLTGILLSLI